MKLSHLALALLMSVPYFATAKTIYAPLAQCTNISYAKGNIYEIETSLYKHTHVTLPEDALDVIWTTPELWKVDWKGSSVFVKPTTSLPDGQETTLSIIGKYGNRYEFLVKRKKSLPVHCYNVVTSMPMIHTTKQQNTDSKDANQSAVIIALQNELAALKATSDQAKKDAERAAKDAMRLYKTTLYTDYTWPKPTFAGQGGIDSVWDDGRFTFIRVAKNSKTLLVVQGEIDGKKHMLDAPFDPATDIYTINGIFPKLVMRANDQEIVITRGQKS